MTAAAPAPSSTYRLQLGPDLDLDRARSLVERLDALGISHVYLSPILEAAPGSTHGYDTVDHGRISTTLGGRRAFDRLSEAVSGSGMGLVVDVVPNHMSIAVPRANRWWWDVLENGPTSRFANHFDITWESSEARQLDTVLMPVLGDHYGVVLEAGELVVERSDDGFVVRYFDHVLPLSPRSVATFLEPIVATAHDSEQVEARLAELNADPDALHEVLEQQHYHLCHWRRAERDLDYRRFFDIDTLIGLRIEERDVFDDTHALILELVRSGQVRGLRIDHPDGLTDPGGYLTRLHEETGGTWTVVEKILEPGESLPEDWPVAGTTGYDFIRVVDGIFRDAAGALALARWWHDHVDADPWTEVVDAAKTEILTSVLAADVSRVADVGLRLCEHHRRHRDHTRHDVTHAVRAIVRAMPVYRTYVCPGAPTRASDRQVIAAAVDRARETAPDVDEDLYAFLTTVLSGEHGGEAIADEFVARFQQLTGPAMAKSVEDTAFYRYLPVPAANEVGGDPGEPYVGVDRFHAHNARIHARWPTTMTALSTHDTKRSADVRARLDALTAIPGRWLDFAGRWAAWCDAQWLVEPHAPTTALLLQAVVGAWPIDPDRLRAYLEKATKEAKTRTSWTDPDPEFDDAVGRLVEALLANDGFLADVVALVDDVLVPGRHIALAKQLLQLTSPGVPDCYQGSELWDLSLVDPDNRRPVDHRKRSELSACNTDAGPDIPLARDEHGEHKLWVTQQALRLRRRRPECFGPGEAGRYEPVDAGDGAVGFRRGDGALVATALSAAAPPFELTLSTGEWTDLLTGSIHRGSLHVRAMVLLERNPS